MPMPSRHFAVNGAPFMFLWKATGELWVGLVGMFLTFIGHTPVDLLFNEHWERDKLEDVIAGAEQILIAIACFWFLGPIFGGWIVLLFYVLASLQDLIDLLSVAYCALRKLPIQEVFPNHPHYKQWAWWMPANKWEPWFAQEAFWLTITLEAVLPGIVILAAQWCW